MKVKIQVAMYLRMKFWLYLAENEATRWQTLSYIMK